MRQRAGASMPEMRLERAGSRILRRRARADLRSNRTRAHLQDPSAAVESWIGDGALEGERKTVTALFADIKGSMDSSGLDPEEARAIVDPALKLMIDAVHRYDGYIVQSTGDGIFALFGAPVAHEDHAQRGLYAGAAHAGGDGEYSAGRRQRGIRRSRSASGSTPARWWCARFAPTTPHRVHADRPLDESGVAHADARADRIDRRHREHAETQRRLLRAEAAGTGANQRRQRTDQRVRGYRDRAAAHAVADVGRARADEVRRAARRDGCNWTARSNSARRAWADCRRDG